MMIPWSSSLSADDVDVIRFTQTQRGMQAGNTEWHAKAVQKLLHPHAQFHSS